jgi:pimeloyl-ACP methyl ester carboxylesterase
MFTNPAISSISLLLSSLVSVSFGQSILPFPIPNGAYNTTLTTMELVDHDRLDPYSNITEPRAVMISLFRPVKCDADHLTDYSTPDTAANSDQIVASAGIPAGTFERLRLQVCDQELSQDNCEDDLPVVIFSPGVMSSRTWYNGLVQWVASYGYHVVSIDHPYDASFVEFPDGKEVLFALPGVTPEVMADAVQTRNQDAKFVLDQMAKASVIRELIPGAKRGLDVRRSAIFGHSLGGATATEALVYDPRLKGAVNLDGSVYGTAVDIDEPRPFLLFGTGVHNQTNDSTWPTFLPHLTGWHRGLIYKNAEHLTYSDGPMLMNMLGLNSSDVPPGTSLQMGDVDGLRNMELLTEYIVTFLDFVLKGKGEGVLHGPNKKYPEIAYNL